MISLSICLILKDFLASIDISKIILKCLPISLSETFLYNYSFQHYPGFDTLRAPYDPLIVSSELCFSESYLCMNY